MSLCRFGILAALVLGVSGSPASAQQTPAPSDVQAALVKVPPEVPASARRYAFLMAGNKAGVLAIWETPDGAHHNFFAFNDRGRGPAILSRFVVNKAGIPTEVDASGNNYLKTPIKEQFRLESGKASWSNESEKGEKSISGASFYVPIDAVLTGELERALLAAPGGRLPLLPEGEARIEKVADRPVEVGGRKHTGNAVRSHRPLVHAEPDVASGGQELLRERQRLGRDGSRGRGSRVAVAPRGAESTRRGARRRSGGEAAEEAGEGPRHRARSPLRQRDRHGPGRHVGANLRRQDRGRREGR